MHTCCSPTLQTLYVNPNNGMFGTGASELTTTDAASINIVSLRPGAYQKKLDMRLVRNGRIGVTVPVRVTRHVCVNCKNC